MFNIIATINCILETDEVKFELIQSEESDAELMTPVELDELLLTIERTIEKSEVQRPKGRPKGP